MIELTHQELVGMKNGPPTEVVHDWPPAMKYYSWPETLYVMENLVHDGWDYIREHGPLVTHHTDEGPIQQRASVRVGKYSPTERAVRYESMDAFIKSTFPIGETERTLPPSKHHFALRACSSLAAHRSRRGYGTILVIPPEPAFSLNILDFELGKGNPYCNVVRVAGLEPNKALALYSGFLNALDHPFFFIEQEDGSVEVVENRHCGTYGMWMTINVAEEDAE